MTGPSDTPLFEETWRELNPPHAGRHQWRGEPQPLPPSPVKRHSTDASTEEIRLPQQDIERVHVYEPTSPLLRRHVVHDARSRQYALPDRGLPTKRVIWDHHGPVYDQNAYEDGKGLGCCTACAGYGLMTTGPFWTGKSFTDQQVQDLYSLETSLDDREIPGRWRPDDTGSAGVYLMKALAQQKLIGTYRHAFTLAVALGALQVGPIAVGVPWFDSMFEPYRGSIHVDPRSQLAGGHEVCVRGYDPRGRGWVLVQNSWGKGWGSAGDGSAWLDVPGFAYLLSQQGDVVQPTIPVASR